jgi:HEAT repeat protein
MSPNKDGSLNSGPDGPKPVRRLQTGTRTLIALVACCGAILWAWRYASENNDPVRVEARSIQNRAIGALKSGKPPERLLAIQELERLGHGDNSIAIPPLVGALEDPVAAVRVAAVEALDSIGSRVAKSGSGGGTVRAAVMGLIRCLKDPDPAVRVASAKALGAIDSNLAGSGSGGETIRMASTALIRSLKDPEPGVRSASAISLGNIAAPRRGFTATSRNRSAS